MILILYVWVRDKDNFQVLIWLTILVCSFCLLMMGQVYILDKQRYIMASVVKIFLLLYNVQYMTFHPCCWYQCYSLNSLCIICTTTNMYIWTLVIFLMDTISSFLLDPWLFYKIFCNTILMICTCIK